MNRAPFAGIFSAERLNAIGVTTEELGEAIAEGELEEFAPGFYYAPEAVTGSHSFAQVAAMVPGGVFCLYSALFLHGLTTQAPHELWIAVPPGSRQPEIPMFPVRFFEFSQAEYSDGICVKRIDEVDLRFYNIPRTIADLFRYRETFGDTVAIEALSEALSDEKTTEEVVRSYALKQGLGDLLQRYIQAALGAHE